MTFLGFRVEKDLREELEGNTEHGLIYVEAVGDFIDQLKEKNHDCVLIEEKNLPVETLVNLIKKVNEFQQKTVVIVIGVSSNLKVVAGSIKAGAYDYLLKPMPTSEILRVCAKAVRDHKLMAERVERNKNIGDKLIGQTKEIVQVYKKIGKVSAGRMPVLVSGEKGTGKKSVALAIHQFGDTSKKPFISINCLSFPHSLLERRLFGYEKGAFEGAIFSQAGELEKANGGTLHLGNVEALSLDVQSKLLYFLQEGEFFRLGGADPIKTDMRIIATSSVDLGKEVQAGRFIEELLDTLKVLEIVIPPLRNRKDDIPFIIDNYLRECNRELNKSVKGVSKPAMKKILRFDWPGNVNELKNAIKSAVAMCRGNTIVIEDLPADVAGVRASRRNTNYQTWMLNEWIEDEIKNYKKSTHKGSYYTYIMGQVEKELIKQVLEQTNGKRIETAEVLGITRNTLRTKMINYGLE
ncbi:sigma-54-dependent Fis family transcriptional regulator [Fusobacterium perfoetens]|uniref:sigma-54-dependent transcriptional regulator n=1 Tax=Fusobacterium perfoetens TaxID=852 RepID=UPI0015A0753D|nr:sigma-54 dependent transcriptional regulator [Fusobacterium perfoetens]MCF2625186.1 sigma-54-dependent Fis family transcriptional regulator [Fusobacterium perfoetens]